MEMRCDLRSLYEVAQLVEDHSDQERNLRLGVTLLMGFGSMAYAPAPAC